VLAHGFTTAQMVELVRTGLAPQRPSASALGGKVMEISPLRIKAAERQALASTQTSPSSTISFLVSPRVGLSK
jgi:hypothetical protein